jgi:hypothetical protein
MKKDQRKRLLILTKRSLGNVRAAITDFKLPLAEDPTAQTRGILPFIVDERAVKIGFPKSQNVVKTFWDNNDYYPYGMLIPERSLQSF